MWKRVLQLSNGKNGEPPTELSADGNGADRIPAVVEPEERSIILDGPGALACERAPALLSDFEQIYQGGAVKPLRLSYGVLKVADMLSSSHLSGMSPDAKRAALMMALDAGGAKMEDILQDAIVRQRVLNDYEEARQRDLQSFEAAIQEQNRAIQAEMDRLTTQYMARMQSNLDGVARAQDNFRAWQKRKQHELQRISDAANCCVPETGAVGGASAGLTVVLERASSAAAR